MYIRGPGVNLIMWSANLGAEVGGVSTGDSFGQFAPGKVVGHFLMARAKNNG